MAPPCGSGRTWSRVVKMTLCLFFLAPMSSVGIGNTNTVFSKKQKLEVRKQLKRVNKPALKTIESPDGDIIDCVDIYNQPAFDHPLLKNHTIKMRPSSYPEGFSFDESNNISSNSKPEITQPWHSKGRCPEGTIPIRRTKEKDSLRAYYGRKKLRTINADTDTSIHEYSQISVQEERYWGMNAEINVWNPQTMAQDEFSLAQSWIAGLGDNRKIVDTIEAGMMVYHDLFGDFETHLFTFWTSDGYASTGCYNLECPGFVQVDTRIAMGAAVNPYSVYDGEQHSMNFFIWKDDAGGGDWWLYLSHRYLLGYWPSSLFSILAISANSVTWGGEVANEQRGGEHTTTQMGSGHFAEEGPGRASFFQNLKLMDPLLRLRVPSNVHRFVTVPNCYNLLQREDYFYFGGPGGSLQCP
uniref:Neprosin PEP catalytic domain-containing protein n=1 Tax=Quercus lobata TaxID=97700 RepID=A0A7N2LD75_QUELO